MRRYLLRLPALCLVALPATSLALVPGTSLAGPATLAAQDPGTLFDSAYVAWDDGDYVAALERLERLLDHPDAETLLPEAAVLTGERYRTIEVAADGRSPRWSPDGRHAAYELPGDVDRTAVVAVGDGGERGDGGIRPVAELDGYGAVFSPSGDRVAWLRTADPEALAREMTQLRERIEVQTREDWNRLREELAGARARHAQLRIRDLVTGREREVAVDDPVHAVEWDGDTLTPRTEPVEAPDRTRAVSPDGSLVAYQETVREDEEIWITEGESEPRRLTHDIQDDLYPQFLAGDRVLVIKGEGRHRRSYVYPTRPGGEPAVREWVPGLGEGMRLFHNNTVRTVAQEYDWAVSPDGTRVLVVADRDGDTISPERGVYLVDLRRPVTLEDVRARVTAQLTAERALRERGRRTFAPLADVVRAAVDDVSLSRIYRYEADLFRFGSKHISQPGNALAIDYLVETLRGFGYEPELQWFEPRGTRSANVIARLPGTTHPDVVYVLSAHFDSNQRGPGADDNTSATAALLEAARVLADRPQPATIEFAFFTGEEAGLLGSREFARRATAEGKNVVAALNNDMVGYANDHRPDNTIRYSNAGIRDIQHAASFLFTDLILYDSHYYRATDAHALYDAFGDVIGGIGSYPILASPHYHQSHDVLETIDHRLVAEVSKATVASILRMAAGPSRVQGLAVRETAGGVELSWDPAPERDVTRWVVAYGPEENPMRHREEVREPRARLPDARTGWRFAVKAVDSAGVEGWDWARAP